MPLDIANLCVLLYPDPALRRAAAAVAGVDDEVRALAQRMIQIMRDEDGVGLAAPQVGVGLRLFVAHVPESDGRSVEDHPPTASAGPVVYINPVLARLEGPVEEGEEGCLSLPDIRGKITRPPRATITALDEQGEAFTHVGAGLLARCWQHEMDHLDGVLIIDRMSQMDRLKNRRALRKLDGR